MLVRYEIFKNFAVLVRCEILKICSVLVRCGPTLKKQIRSRCGAVRPFKKFFGPGAVWSDFSKKNSVRCGPIFLNFYGAGAVRSHFFNFAILVRCGPSLVRFDPETGYFELQFRHPDRFLKSQP